MHSACVPNEFSYILPTNFIRARHMTDAWRRNDHVAFRRPMYPADFVQVLKYGLHLDGLSPKKQPLVITCCFNFRAVGNWKTSNKLNIFSLGKFPVHVVLVFTVDSDWPYAGIGVMLARGGKPSGGVSVRLHEHFS